MPKLAEVRFNEKTALRAKPREKMYELRDLGYRGLVLRVFTSGTKRFIYQYARGKRVTLGDASKMTLTAARQRCTNLQTKLDGGHDIKRPEEASPVEDFVKGEYKTWAVEHQKDGKANVDRVLTACASLMPRKLDELSQINIKSKLINCKISEPAGISTFSGKSGANGSRQSNTAHFIDSGV